LFWRHDASGSDQAIVAAVVSLPLCDCIGTRCASDIATSNPTTVLLGRHNRAVPCLIVGHRSFDREQFAIFIDDN
jgi:hypothetical protein